jgi:hypothetical protein
LGKDTEKIFIQNSECIKAKSLLRSVKAKGKKNQQEELCKICSTKPLGFKVYYSRYADD